ncbi:hypothetical protein E3N88_31517 [Mikania micrantha]|uniref:TPX2 C-terminal domain-containing protein n=1 Tax=Mikania micrantha TaxID=192012 RepID=A0A5N6MQ40_9ASTR|nr:hypothetical protein E3N88_31517 [Mikania micrantha]
MAGEIEEPFRLNFQTCCNRVQSPLEDLNLIFILGKKINFPHNRYLEEVEKYSKPGSVTEKKAYFEAEFRRKALLKQRSSECQDGGESPTVTNSEMYAFEEYDTTSQHLESQSQNELGETHQSENENVAGNTEQSVELTHVDHAVLVDVSSVANDDSSLACQTSKKDNGSISISTLTTISPKVNPAAEKKLTRSTVKSQANADWFQKQVLNGGSKGSMKPRTSESKGLLVKKTEKKTPLPASPLIRSGVKSLKAEFYTKIAEKVHAKEVEINQVEAKTLVTPINKTSNQPHPRSQAMATRHDRNPLKSSIPLNIRLSSSISSTNRICISESVGRNHASANIDKGKDKKLNKQKDLETRGRDMVKRHVKGIHTWHGPKVGILS